MELDIIQNKIFEIRGFKVMLDFDLAFLYEVDTKTLNQAIPQELYAESLMSLNPQIFQWLEYLDQNIIIILSLMAIVACINMITALLILIIERTNMIGILKSMGADNQSIRRVFLIIVSYIIFLGLLMGNVIGLCFLSVQKKKKTIQKDAKRPCPACLDKN